MVLQKPSNVTKPISGTPVEAVIAAPEIYKA